MSTAAITRPTNGTRPLFSVTAPRPDSEAARRWAAVQDRFDRIERAAATDRQAVEDLRDELAALRSRFDGFEDRLEACERMGDVEIPEQATLDELRQEQADFDKLLGHTWDALDRTRRELQLPALGDDSATWGAAAPPARAGPA